MVETENKAISDLLGKEELLMDKELQNLFAECDMQILNPVGVAILATQIDRPSTNAERQEMQIIGNVSPEKIQSSYLADVESLWNTHDMRRIKVCKSDEELKELKISCSRCLKFENDTLEGSPVYNEFLSMKLVKKHVLERTYTARSGHRTKINTGVDYLFTCPICQAKKCVFVEVE